MTTTRMNMFTGINDAMRVAMKADENVILFGEVSKRVEDPSPSLSLSSLSLYLLLLTFHIGAPALPLPFPCCLMSCQSY